MSNPLFGTGFSVLITLSNSHRMLESQVTVTTTFVTITFVARASRPRYENKASRLLATLNGFGDRQRSSKDS
jgi:hypothetical protein